MNKLREHIPTFVDTREPPGQFEFETTEDLLNLDISTFYQKIENFSHFARSRNMFMAIYEEGYHWWVIGYLEKPEDVDLPIWDGGKYREGEK